MALDLTITGDLACANGHWLADQLCWIDIERLIAGFTMFVNYFEFISKKLRYPL